MARSPDSVLSDARDIARRFTLQLLVLGGGLILVWSVTFEAGLRSVSNDQRSLAASMVRARTLASNIGALERETNDLRAMAREKSAEQRLFCTQLPDSTACISARAQARKAIAKAELAQKRRQANDKAAQDLDRDMAKLKDKLSERVSFDIGQGIKLPFELAFAPPAWLALSAFLLWRMGQQRALFWSQIARAVLAARRSGADVPARSIFDAPFWFAPAGRTKAGAKAAELYRVVSWAKSWRVKRRLQLLLLVIWGALAARVFWIGAFLLSVGMVSSSAGTSFAVFLGLVFAAGANAALAIWLIPAHRISEWVQVPRLSGVSRREVISSGAILGFGVVTASAASIDTLQRRWQALLASVATKFRRTPPRRGRPFVVVDALPEPVWVLNRRSLALHQIRQDGTIRRGKGLKAKNLRLMAVEAARTFLKRPPPWSFDEGAALVAVRAGQWSTAFRNALEFSVLEPSGARLRRLDFAMGLAQRFGSTGAIGRALEMARREAGQTTDADLAAQISARIKRWTEPESAAWRRKRWSRAHPFRWHGLPVRLKDGVVPERPW